MQPRRRWEVQHEEQQKVTTHDARRITTPATRSFFVGKFLQGREEQMHRALLLVGPCLLCL